MRFLIRVNFAPAMKTVTPLLNDVQQIDILLEEYRALYGLLQWRLAAGDRRLLISGALLTGALTAICSLDAVTAQLLLWGLPVLLWVIVSATAGHARSKEDLLRRIDEIERHINLLAQADLLAFQSRRRQRDRVVGGRTGLRTINGTLVLCIVVLLGAVIAFQPARGLRSPASAALGLWAIAWAGLMVREAALLKNYRYERQLVWDSNEGS